MPPIINNPADNLKPDAPDYGGAMMINFRETLLPDTAEARRAAARGLEAPKLIIETEENARPRARCPNCNGLRPFQCIVKAKGGWKCDGCISDERRRGVFEEHDVAERQRLKGNISGR